MPDQEQSIPAPIPRIDPAEWDEGFRETLLLHFTDPEANTTLRRVGSLLFNLSLEYAALWPHYPEGETRAELRAAVADLRHLEGFLTAVGREHEVSSLSEDEDVLSLVTARQAVELSRIADRDRGCARREGVAMARLPNPLTWKRRNFAVFEPMCPPNRRSSTWRCRAPVRPQSSLPPWTSTGGHLHPGGGCRSGHQEMRNIHAA